MTGGRRTLLAVHLPALVWLLVVGVLLSLPAASLEPLAGLVEAPGLDKLVHGLLFAVLAVLLRRSFAALRMPRAALAAVLVAVLYGALTEAAQRWQGRGRTGEWGDLAADLAGASLAGALAAGRGAGRGVR